MSPVNAMFTDIQKAEIRDIARELIQDRKWEELPWKDAWNGAYAIRPTKYEIEVEATILEEKAIKIITEDLSGEPYPYVKDLIRVMSLESAKTFNLYEHKWNS